MGAALFALWKRTDLASDPSRHLHNHHPIGWLVSNGLRSLAALPVNQRQTAFCSATSHAPSRLLAPAVLSSWFHCTTASAGGGDRVFNYTLQVPFICSSHPYGWINVQRVVSLFVCLFVRVFFFFCWSSSWRRCGRSAREGW